MGSNAGIVGTTKEHLGLALALSVPVFVVVTKIDMCPPNVLQVFHIHSCCFNARVQVYLQKKSDRCMTFIVPLFCNNAPAPVGDPVTYRPT